MEPQLWTPNNHSQWQIQYRLQPLYTTGYKHIAELLETCYDLGPVCGMERLTSKVEDSSRNWRVETEKGSYHVKEILRFRGLGGQAQKEREQQTLDTIVGVTRHLLGHGIKTIPLTPTYTGEKYVTGEGIAPVIVSPFIKGHHYQGTIEQLIHFATELGRIHKAMAGYPRDKLARSEHVELKYDPAALSELKQMNARAIAADPHAIDVAAQAAIALLETMLPQIMEDMERCRFRSAITMGDLHPHDTLYQGDTLQAVFDWEKTSFGYPRMEEVAFSLHRFVRQRMVWMQEAGQREVTHESVQTARDAFLTAYGLQVPVMEREVMMLPALIAKTNAHKALRILSYHYGLAEDSMQRTPEQLQASLEKFHVHLLESAYFGERPPR